MHDWRLRQRFGHGAARVPLCPEPCPSGEGTAGLAAALNALGDEWRDHGLAAGLRDAAWLAPGVALVLTLLLAVAVTALRAPRDEDLIVVAFEPVVEPLPEPPPEPRVELEPAPAPETPREAPRPEPPPPAPVVERPPEPPAPEAKPPARPELPAVVAALPRPTAPPPQPERTRPVARPAPDVGPVRMPAAPRLEPPAQPRRSAPQRSRPALAQAPRPRPEVRIDSLVAPAVARPEVPARVARPEAPPRVARPSPEPRPRVGLAPELALPAASQRARSAPPALPQPPAPSPARPQPAPRSARPASLAVAALPAASPPRRQVPAAPRRIEREAAPERRSQHGPEEPRLSGVALGSLAACVSDREEDALKLRLMAARGDADECRSAAGRYRFVETKNLNAFLMWVERAATRGEADRCVELNLALECLAQRQGRSK